MGDHRFTIKIEFSMHGIEDKWDANLNWSPNAYPIDDRIVDWIDHVAGKAMDKYQCDLKAWCQRCHNRYDVAERRKGIRDRKRAASAAGDLFG